MSHRSGPLFLRLSHVVNRLLHQRAALLGQPSLVCCLRLFDSQKFAEQLLAQAG
jgi:hypothetical protein